MWQKGLRNKAWIYRFTGVRRGTASTGSLKQKTENGFGWPRRIWNQTTDTLKKFTITGLILTTCLNTWGLADDREITGNKKTGTASWYSTEACRVWEARGVYNCPTASGKSLYDLEAQGVLYAAAWDLPFNTRVRVTNLANGKSVTVQILDRGPAKRLNRVIDLSRSGFEKIADPKQGLIRVVMEVLP